MYRLLLAATARWVPAEAAHRAGFALIRAAAAVPGAIRLLRSWLRPGDPVLRVEAFGLEFPGPLGLAAGFDKDGLAPEALGALGFSFVEVGTVTAEPQPGGPRPRLARLPADHALVNRMGFNNDGAAAVAARLHGRRRPDVIVGVNIGKTAAVPGQSATADYAASAGLVAAAADYLVVNVSSPNTPGVRDLQTPDTLRPLLAAVRDAAFAAAGRQVPLLAKISPDLADADIDAIADLALEVGLDGIIATNTTIGREHVVSGRGQVESAGPGGLSGRPLRPRSLEVLRRLHARVGEAIPLVSVGGIETAADAWERILAGATLLQGYTGFVYGGPLWAHRVQSGLARRIRRAGFASLPDAVGAGRRAGPPPAAASGRGRGGAGSARRSRSRFQGEERHVQRRP